MTITRLPRAENETRTRDPNLGKVVLYQLSYFRSCMASSAGGQAPFGSANIRAYSDSSKLFRQKISLSPPFSGAALRVGGSGSPNKPTRCRRNQAVPQQASRIPNSRCPAAVVRPTDRRIRKTSHSAVRLSQAARVPQPEISYPEHPPLSRKPTRCRCNQAISHSATMSQSHHRCSSALFCSTSRSRSPTLNKPPAVPQTNRPRFSPSAIQQPRRILFRFRS